MDPWSAAWLWDWLRLHREDALLLTRRHAAFPWIGVDGPSDADFLQADHAGRQQETANFQLGGPEKLFGADDPRHVLQTNGGLADIWYMDDGDILCHPLLVPTYSLEFDVANAKV